MERLDLTRRRVLGVMGSRVDGWGGFRRLQPLSANWRRGVFSKGLPTPDGSGALLLGMYWQPWFDVVQLIRVDSDAGSGKP